MPKGCRKAAIALLFIPATRRHWGISQSRSLGDNKCFLSLPPSLSLSTSLSFSLYRPLFLSLPPSLSLSTSLSFSLYLPLFLSQPPLSFSLYLPLFLSPGRDWNVPVHSEAPRTCSVFGRWSPVPPLSGSTQRAGSAAEDSRYRRCGTIRKYSAEVAHFAWLFVVQLFLLALLLCFVVQSYPGYPNTFGQRGFIGCSDKRNCSDTPNETFLAICILLY